MCPSNLAAAGVNGKEATINRVLDGSTYPDKKLVHSVFGKINYGVQNTTAYTWDWYCHLVGDRASLKNFLFVKYKRVK